MNNPKIADIDAQILTGHVRAHQPFLFLRYGDGAMLAMSGHPGQTCDGEPFTPMLASDLKEGWRAVVETSSSERIYIGDWMSASFKPGEPDYQDEYDKLLGDVALRCWRGALEPGSNGIGLLHFETLLPMRLTEPLRDFYRAVRDDRRKKLVMGPSWVAEQAKALGAEHLETPMHALLARAWFFEHALMRSDFEVLLFGAGLAGLLPVIRCWQRFPRRTYIHAGSAFDPLSRITRTQQRPVIETREFFRGILCAS